MQYETANITYKGLEDKGLTVTLLDENKKKWTIWKKDYKNKEQDSDAYAALQQFKLGDRFGVSYQEKDESFLGKDGKQVSFKRKTIYSIMPIIAQPTSEMATSKPQGQNALPQANSYVKDETTAPDWDNIAVGKCQTVFLQAYIQAGHTLQEAKLQVTQARQLAELVVFGQQKTMPEEAPTPTEVPPEVTPEQFPF